MEYQNQADQIQFPDLIPYDRTIVVECCSVDQKYQQFRKYGGNSIHTCLG